LLGGPAKRATLVISSYSAMSMATAVARGATSALKKGAQKRRSKNLVLKKSGAQKGVDGRTCLRRMTPGQAAGAHVERAKSNTMPNAVMPDATAASGNRISMAAVEALSWSVHVANRPRGLAAAVDFRRVAVAGGSKQASQ
jgi:hypothetical protein